MLIHASRGSQRAITSVPPWRGSGSSKQAVRLRGSIADQSHCRSALLYADEPHAFRGKGTLRPRAGHVCYFPLRAMCLSVLCRRRRCWGTAPPPPPPPCISSAWGQGEILAPMREPRAPCRESACPPWLTLGRLLSFTAAASETCSLSRCIRGCCWPPVERLAMSALSPARGPT